MANTVYLTKEVEPSLINWASEKIGVGLFKRKLAVGQNRKDNDVSFEVDGISKDTTVGAFASAAGCFKAGQERKLFMDTSVLLRLPFRRRLMVFIEDEVWAGFENSGDDRLDLHLIEPLVCRDLSVEMRAQIESVRAEARREGGDSDEVPGLEGNVVETRALMLVGKPELGYGNAGGH